MLHIVGIDGELVEAAVDLVDFVGSAEWMTVMGLSLAGRKG